MEENSIDKIIEQIFTKSPKQPHTYTIEFEPPPNTSFEQQTQFLFRELCYVLRKGCGHLFPHIIQNDQMDVSLLTFQNFIQLNQYFQSFGYTIRYKILQKNSNLQIPNIDLLDENYVDNLLEDNDYSIENLPELPENNLSPENTKKELKDYSYLLSDTRRNIDYEIRFDYFVC